MFQHSVQLFEKLREKVKTFRDIAQKTIKGTTQLIYNFIKSFQLNVSRIQTGKVRERVEIKQPKENISTLNKKLNSLETASYCMLWKRNLMKHEPTCS